MWAPWVPFDKQNPDDEGNWLGWCPIHDKTGRKNRPYSAVFNFVRSSVRCLREEQPCNAPKKAMSLMNAYVKSHGGE